MGDVNHCAIVVTSWDSEKANEAHKRAVDLFGSHVTNMVGPVTNGFMYFMIAPSGSKVGWTRYIEHEYDMKIYEKYLMSKAFDDGSTTLAWVELSFGEPFEPSVVAGSGMRDRNLCEDVG